MTTIAGTVLAISQVSLGDVLAADATAGDTTITVDDAADFAEGGGTILIGGQLDDYTSVDDETGVMVLVDALNADALQGDRVDLADPAGSPALEWQALVAPQGTVDTDEAIQATITYAIVPLLPEGIRDPGTGESVTLTRDGTEWQVTNVHGQQPSIESGNLRGGIPVADVTYRDPNTSLAFGSGLANTTDFVFGDGNQSEWFAYQSISVSAGGVSLLQAGWYQVECRSGGGANAAGDVVRITAHLVIGNVSALDIADGSTNIVPRVLTLPFYYDGTYDFIVGVDVDGPPGGAAYQPTISVVAFGP